MDDVQRELQQVAKSIARVEASVEVVEAEIKAAQGNGDKVEVAALRETAKQLRDKENHLRENENKLRDKENLLLQRSGASFCLRPVCVTLSGAHVPLLRCSRPRRRASSSEGTVRPYESLAGRCHPPHFPAFPQPSEHGFGRR